MKIKSGIMRVNILIVTFCVVAPIVYVIYYMKAKSANKRYAVNHGIVGEKHDINKFHEKPDNAHELREIKNIIQQINERQHLINNNNYSGPDFNYTVLVIRVHPNITYLAVFFDSIRRIVGIGKSLLIFAHDYYDEDINKAITTLQFARVMQIFYPYSIQLHPNSYPGEDSEFCQELDVCTNSKERDPELSQSKLFWWWVTNQVFDHIEILKNYNGYIYFLETEQYLINDFIFMAKAMERLQPSFCAECRFLSLGARHPQSELYSNSNMLVVGVWGWSNYSNSGFGFNRTTWNEIKGLKEQFCYFEDASWENSLKHLALKTREHNFFMLFIEAPRFIPTSGCGAFRSGTDCDLDVVYKDIVTFMPTIKKKRFSSIFTLSFDSSMTKIEVEARGHWGDARDRELCMFFSSNGRRVYY